jgi:hypothetical protein
MGNATLVWWLLGAPVVLAIVDRMMMGGSSAMSLRDSRTSTSSR